MELIAEIGNNHFGSLNRFKEMIRIAHECGATKVKAQAIDTEKPLGGSMPQMFYHEVALEPAQYLEALEYARDMGVDLFYSVFSPELSWLTWHQDYQKISASQMNKVSFFRSVSRENFYVSVNDEFLASGKLVYLHKTKSLVFYATPYNTTFVDFSNLQALSAVCPRYGLSDHSIGIGFALEAKQYGISGVEKHFTLDKNWKFANHVFRDTVHGCNPKELELLAKGLGL